MAESNVKLIVDATQAVGPLKKTTVATEKLEKAVQGTNGRLRDASGRFKSTGKAAATATGNIQRFGVAFRTTLAPIVAATGAVTLLTRSLNLLGQRQADTAALSNGLQKLGEGEQTLNRLQASADALGKTTLFDQEDFDRGFALLTSFQRIGVDSYERVAKAAADVAQITGQDVRSALLQLSKALEDPARRVTDLSRSGTVFTEQQKEQIKALQESGRLIEAQNLVLSEIEKQYGGAAEAAGKAGYAGAVDSLGESFRDFQETLANAVQPAVVGALGAFTNLFDVLSKIPAPASQLAIEIGLVAGGIVALTKAVQAFLGTKLAAAIGTQIGLMKAFGAQIYLTAAAQGVLNAAVTAFPAAIAVLAIGSLIKTLYDAKTAQARFEKAVKSGSVETIKSAIAIEEETLSVERNKAAKMSLLGINAKLLKSQQRLTKLRAALSEAEGKSETEEDPPKPKKPPGTDPVKDMSRRLLNLNNQLRAAEEAEQQRLAATLKLMVEKQKISEGSLGPIAKENALQEALSNFRQEIFRIDKKIATQREKDLEKAAEGFEAQMAHQDQLRQAIAEQKSQYEELNTTFRNGIVNSILDAVEGTKSLSESLAGVLRQMARMILQQQLMNALGGFNLFGGGGGATFTSPSVLTSGLDFSGAFANGGRPAVGKAALVGERGPELFVPDRAGTIVPNNALGGANVVVNVDASGTQAQGNQPNAKALGAAIGAAVQAELVKQKRPGGLLS